MPPPSAPACRSDRSQRYSEDVVRGTWYVRPAAARQFAGMAGPRDRTYHLPIASRPRASSGNRGPSSKPPPSLTPNERPGFSAAFTYHVPRTTYHVLLTGRLRTPRSCRSPGWGFSCPCGWRRVVLPTGHRGRLLRRLPPGVRWSGSGPGRPRCHG